MSVFNDETMAIERIVADFELAWKVSREVDLLSYIPDSLNTTVRQRLLWELVETDLELRIKSGVEARVEDYLKQFPDLASDESRLIAFVQSEFRLRSRRVPSLDPNEYDSRFPAIADKVRSPRRQSDRTDTTTPGAIDQPIELDQTGRSSSGDPPTSVGRRTSDSGRFRLLKPHDEGGLGKVWLAYDDELQREVALKEIREKYADDSVSRFRFTTEVLVTSGLEHPGIVPVYGFSHYQDGRPYYTMRFVKGVSFRDAIRAFHDEWSRRPAGAQKIEMQRLLGHFLDVCNTIDYAHQRGVLHRDIKPSNIMLGDYGETLVLDWGLAKRIGEPDPRAKQLMPSTMKGNDKSFATKIGHALGSPAYMSPEQARGEHDQLGPPADIYSLGATLYTILTNRAPIEGDATEQVLATVIDGQIPRPRSVHSNIAVTLESICLKAMAPEPDRRYRTARELATDIERYLADQPVSSHRESLFERLARFTRNNDALVRAATLALIVVTVTSFIAALLIDEQRRIAEQFAVSESASRRTALNARLRADAQHSRAERYLELLKSAFELPDDGSSGHEITLYEGLDRAVQHLRSA